VHVAAVITDPALKHRIEAALDNAGLPLVRIVRHPEELEGAGPPFAVALIAEDMGDVRTAEVLRRLREHTSAEHVLIVRTESDAHAVRRALEAGADGLLEAPDLERTLLPALRAVEAGLIAVPTTLRRQIVPPALSHRERQVLALVVEGCTNGEIAARLFLAESTVKSHLATAFAKLGVRSRRDATALILQTSDDPLSASVLTLADRSGRGARFAAPSLDAAQTG
jgi:DNA-binding NarL/FixJ family response regulator